MTEGGFFTCGHCNADLPLPEYVAHVKNCLNVAVAVQTARKPPRFSYTSPHRLRVQIPITVGTRRRALEDMA